MDVEQFKEILSSDEICGTLINKPGCHVVKGLLVIRKYLPDYGVENAGYRIIYSANANLLVDAGITEEDAILLRKYNWMVKGGFLACFV